MRILILAAAALLGACVTAPVAAPRPVAHIAPDLVLALPTPPGYPSEAVLSQVVRGQFGERQGVFEAVLSLGAERVEIVLTAAGGPRLATIIWDESGVTENRALIAGDEIPVENILADVFVCLWPEEAVRAALPDGTELAVSGAARTITRDGAVVVEVAPDAADSQRVVVRNEALGYQVTIVSRVIG